MEVSGGRVLLNGFKRYRCARKLRLGTVPYASLGRDEAAAMIGLLRVSNERGAVDFGAGGVSGRAERGAGSVGGGDRRPAVAEQGLGGDAAGADRLDERAGAQATVRAGLFPVYAYMYTLRPSCHAHERPGGGAVCRGGERPKLKRTRDRGVLARAFFQGKRGAAGEVDCGRGQIAPVLARLREPAMAADGCSERESRLLRDLEIGNRAMWRVRARCGEKLSSGAFRAHARLRSEAILSRAAGFTETVKLIYDRSGPA